MPPSASRYTTEQMERLTGTARCLCNYLSVCFMEITCHILTASAKRRWKKTCYSMRGATLCFRLLSINRQTSDRAPVKPWQSFKAWIWRYTERIVLNSALLVHMFMSALKYNTYCFNNNFLERLDLPFGSTHWFGYHSCAWHVQQNQRAPCTSWTSKQGNKKFCGRYPVTG